MLAALSSREPSGHEWIEASVWHRRLDLDGAPGCVSVAHLPDRNAVAVTIRFPSVKALPAIVARVRRVFDLGADISTIDSHLARDPALAPLIARRPGLRAPGDWDVEGMEMPLDGTAPPAWRPWHAYAAQHLRMARHA
jgi:AraC family transcriptional regulator of adaptative response / DNA-3-methyladenine glycosylase II